jgi:CTP:molybdopterin cytidylyltransferase MocA
MTTGIIPVAGQGSRLGVDRPKALVEIGGRTLLSYVLDALSPVVDSLVLVVMPGAETAFEDEVRALGWIGSVRISVQATPSGSADAVRVAIDAISDEEPCVLVWGDQVGVSRQTVTRVATALDDGFLGMVLPLTEVESPYVWYSLDGDVVKVGRRRDGDISPLHGKSDVGTFGFLAGQVRPWLAFDGFGDHDAQRESDFVYVVPQLAASHGLRVIDVGDATETLGVNDPNDLERARMHLSGSPR